MTGPKEFMRHVENTLGWHPPKGYAAQGAYAQRISARMGESEAFTWHNLELAVELLRREKLPRSPMGVFHHVARAVAMEVDVEEDLDVAVRNAIAIEVAKGDPDGWESRFTRCHPLYREQLLTEYRSTR